MPSNYGAYLGLAVLVVIAPGPDFAVVMKNCLMHGRRPGLFTSLGIVSSLLVQGVAAALGVAALILRSATAFNVVKVVGAAYLGFLGLQALRSALARRRDTPSRGGGSGETYAGGRSEGHEPDGPDGPGSATPERASGRPPGRWPMLRAFRQGFLSNITNPKVLAFYFSLLPQFVDSHRPALPQVLLLAATHAFFALIWLLIVVAVLHRLREFLRRSRVRRSLEGFTGVALVGLGVRLIMTPR